MKPSKLELLSLAYRQQPQHKVMPKAKRTWAMPNKIKGIGNNLTGARIVSPMGDGISTDSRGQQYTRLPSGQVRKLSK